jgi:soluble lytic murein transglycosylase-like protein
MAGSLLLALAPGTAPAAEPATSAPAPSAPAAAASAAVSAAASAAEDDRRIVRYTVRPGDTATELAVRYHAWTAELIRMNRLGPSAMLYVGQRIRIPVVVDAVRKHASAHKKPTRKPATKHKTKPKPKTKHKTTKKHHGWRYPDPSRATVRREIIRTSRRLGVDPQLALAVSWQEAGWQMHHVSSADAIGAMQVIPGTGVWMSMYAGRPLHLHRLHDNVLAGVLLLDVLDANTRTTQGQLAAYYQGLGALREHGMYRDTRRYVANVLAIKHRLERGWSPA